MRIAGFANIRILMCGYKMRAVNIGMHVTLTFKNACLAIVDNFLFFFLQFFFFFHFCQKQETNAKMNLLGVSDDSIRIDFVLDLD